MDSNAPSPQFDSLQGCVDTLRQLCVAQTGEQAQAVQDTLARIENLAKAQAAREQNLAQQLEAAQRAAGEAAELAVRREAELIQMVDAIADVILIYDTNGIPIHANQAAVRAYGFDPTGRDRHQIADRLLTRDAAGNLVNPARRPLSRALRGEVVRDERYLFRNAEEQDRTILASATPILTASGKVDRVVAIWHDITQIEQLNRLARQAARESRQMLVQSEAVFNSLTDGVIVYTPDGVVRQANPRAIALLGFDPLRLSQDRVLDRLKLTTEDESPLPLSESTIARALQGETIINQSMWMTNALRRNYVLQVSVSPFSIGKEFTGAVVVLHDRTDRERLLEENLRQRELLERVVRSVPSGLALLTGPDLVCQMHNSVYRSLTPHPEVDPLGLALAEVWQGSCAPDLDQLVRQVIAAGEPKIIDDFSLTYSDGKALILRLHINPLDWENQTAALLVTWDLTALEEAHRQARLAAEEARRRAAEAEEGQRILDAMMEYIPEGITIADAPDVTIRRVSKYGQLLTGRPAEAFEGIPMQEHPLRWQIYALDGKTLLPAEDLPLSRATQKGEVVDNEELVMRRMDGESIYILCNAAPILSADGTITGGLIAWRDVTTIKNADQALNQYTQQLQRVNRELEDFAFIASHDLQEPLRKVKSFGDLLVKNYADRLEDNGKEYVVRMNEAVQRMQDMLNGLLSYSRISTQGDPFTQVDLNQVFGEVCSDLDMRINQTMGQVSAGPLPVITADPLQMRQLFQNLLGNALKFHHPQVAPVVKVWAETGAENTPDEGMVRLYVQDNGIGFKEEFAEKIFQPFVRLEGRSAYEGTGMGLPICEKIAKRHGGRIAAHSTPDQGATFIVVLPVERVISEK